MYYNAEHINISIFVRRDPRYPHCCTFMAFFVFVPSSEENDGKTESKDEKGKCSVFSMY